MSLSVGILRVLVQGVGGCLAHNGGVAVPEGSEPVVIDAFVDGQFGAVDRQSWVEQFVDSKWENRFDVVWQIAVIALTVETLAILALTFINHSKR